MGRLFQFPTSPETGLDIPAADSSPSVMLTVGQLRQIMREEIRSASDCNQRSESGKTAPVLGQPNAMKPYLSVAEAADLARVAPSTIRLYIRKGQLKRQKVGSRVIISREELERFLGSQSSTVVGLYST